MPNRRVLLAGALVAGALLVALAVRAADRPAAQDLSVGDVVRVGVAHGGSIPAYVEASRRELAGLPAGLTYALVTLDAYVAPDRLAPIISGVEMSAVYARVPLPRTQTEIVRLAVFSVPDDVLAGMGQVAERKAREARDHDAAAARLGERRDWYASAARVAAAEAAAYRRQCSCVYAAIVRGEPAALARLAGRSGVRVVDPAPEIRRLDRTVFLPPLPEQARVAQSPADGSLVSPTAVVS